MEVQHEAEDVADDHRDMRGKADCTLQFLALGDLTVTYFSLYTFIYTFMT